MNQTPNNLKTYETAKSLLGKHLTLDPSVPKDLGCAQAVSYVLKQAGVEGIPAKGFSGTRELFDFLNVQRKYWYIDKKPLPGDIAICVTGESTKGVPHGHVGIWGNFNVMSNNSENGLWEANYTILGWKNFFEMRSGFITHYFRRL